MKLINYKYPRIIFLLGLVFLMVSTVNASVDCIGDRVIENETDLQNLVAENCRTIDGALVVNSPTLTNLDGLEGLEAIYWTLILDNNPFLNDLTGLINLNLVVWDIEITNNDSLTSLEGLNNLEEINGDWVWIAENNNLVALCLLCLKDLGIQYSYPDYYLQLISITSKTNQPDMISASYAAPMCYSRHCQNSCIM